jgi:predicted nuclease with TOPRIM domain
MDLQRSLSPLGRKVRTIRRSSSTLHSVSDSDPSPSEETLRLETQKKIVMNKLTQLSQEYAVEEQKRKKLEEEVIRARSRASGTFPRTLECEEIRDRIRQIQGKLSGVESNFKEHLDGLAALRRRIDAQRAERIEQRRSKRKSTPPPPPEPSVELELPKQLIRLTEGERQALLRYQREAEKFTRLSAARRTSGSLTVEHSDPSPGEIITETEGYQIGIRKILDTLQLNSLLDLFVEAERIEKDNRETYLFIAENDEERRRMIDEIGELEQKYKKLSAGKEERERELMSKLAKLNLDLLAMHEELGNIAEQKQRDAVEFSVVYAGIEELFNALQCLWDDSPDGSMTVSATNALFALGSIEQGLSDMMAAMAKAGATEAGPGK